MRRMLFTLVLTGGFGAVSAAAADRIVSVPQPNADVRFDHELGQYTAFRDNAAALIGDRAVITAVRGSVFREESAPNVVPEILLLKGGFRVHAGRAPIRIRVGKAVVELCRAEAIFLRLRDGSWLCEIEKKAAEGRVTWTPSGTPDDAAPKFVAPLELRTPRFIGAFAPIAVPLVTGTVVALDGGDLRPAARADARKTRAVVSALAPPVRREPKLVPVDVVDPADLMAPKSGLHQEASGFEVEPIELDIEAGCIEVCND